jgi:hypothetical protein
VSTSLSPSPSSSPPVNVKRRRSSSPPEVKPSTDLLADKETRTSYRIGRGEEGVLTFKPYKSRLLPLWRFATPDLAETSSEKIWKEFERFDEQRDFVGMDMARKFLVRLLFLTLSRLVLTLPAPSTCIRPLLAQPLVQQMGMARATRYARRPGGRKYDKETGELLPITDHPGAKVKEQSAAIFRAAWERAKAYEGFKERRKEWEAEKKEYEKERKTAVKDEGEDEDDEPQLKKRKKAVKKVVKKEEEED